MYNIIPLILILISLTVIITIVLRKFPVLANLDVENMPVEREARFKELIISNRLKRNIFKYWGKFNKILKPLGAMLYNFFRWLGGRLSQLKENYKKVDIIKGAATERKIDNLFAEAEEYKKQGDLTMAEKKYIEIIGLDSRNISGFKALGGLFIEQKNYEEAKQTFEHILKLKEDDEDVYDNLAQIAKEKGDLNSAKNEYLKSLEINKQNAQTYFNLSLINHGLNNMEEAIANIKKALKVEPNNPRYLDTMLDLSIIRKDKISALDAYKRLFKVNPENNKLNNFKKQIDEL